MAGRFPFTKLPKYPHMKPEDIAVWERFIDANPGYFETVDYDVAVGPGSGSPQGTPENLKHMQKTLTQKKIDVVGYIGNTHYVCEVGPVADMRKLGQILTYIELYAQERPDASFLEKMVVVGAIERDLDQMFQKHGILVEVA